MNKQEALEFLFEQDKEVNLLGSTQAILEWDQETQLPSEAVEGRSKQLSLLASIIHGKIVDPRVEDALSTLGASDDHPTGDYETKTKNGALIRGWHKAYARSSRLSEEFVKRLSEATSIGQARWAEARKENDFAKFQPHLETIIELKREAAEAIGYAKEPYDALLDEFEPNTSSEEIEKVFSQLKQDLVPIVKAISEAEQVDTSPIYRKYPVETQEAFGRSVLKAMNYDLQRGRLDLSTHPFTTTLGFDDVRITARYDEGFFNTGIFSIIHEAGHGLYEQGFDRNLVGLSLAEGTSLGIHESQSRTWENLVGRSYEFWQYFYPQLQNHMDGALKDVSLESFWRAINAVEPSFIRVEADEVTYNLHVMLRFNLELRLIRGELEVKDLPEAWRAESKALLGIIPEKDSDGVLQDVHWSAGLVGYFPTYALGNLYGSQFFNAMKNDLPDLKKQIASGELGSILNWLRDKIHHFGAQYTAQEISENASGERLNPVHWVNYIKEKYSKIYRITL